MFRHSAEIERHLLGAGASNTSKSVVREAPAALLPALRFPSLGEGGLAEGLFVLDRDN